MSDTITPWTDHEVLVYLLTAMEHSKIKPDYKTAPVPPGRSASGVEQKIRGLKKFYKAEMDALSSGTAVSSANGKSVKGKRMAEDGDGEKPKKRGRPKKALEPETKIKQEATPESEIIDGPEEEKDET